ncbi:MAG TPA: AzlD domain-containing protein, partial [Pseudolabrys sp.]|nr:AzlD domain-containing protein [Pseudolabrys sp.]
MSESNPTGFIAVIVLMGLAAFLMRAGGYWLIGRIPIGPRVYRMLDVLPGAVIAASVAPLALKGGVSALLAVAAAGATMLVVRNDFVAVVVGV